MESIILKQIRNHAFTDKVAMSSNKMAITYKELDSITNNMANQLSRLLDGNRQRPVIIYQKCGIKFIEFILTVHKCNCYYIPLEEGIPVERVRNIVNDINPALILTDSTVDMDIQSCKVIDICYDKSESDCFELNDVMEDDLVYVMYTSGTNGHPKGVKIKYTNLENLVVSFYDVLFHKFDQPVKVGVLASFSFDSSVKQIYNALFYGHELVISDSSTKYFGRKIHDFFLKNNLTLSDITPSHLKIMITQSVATVSQIPYLIVGGEKLRWEILHQYIDFVGYTPDFINVYGPTECCVDVADNYITKEDLENNKSGDVPIGIAIRNTKLLLRNEDESVITQKNVEGELCVSGKQVGAGYVNVESDSFVKKDDVTEYRTGDIGYFDCDNKIVVKGRKDKQVKINGNRVELEEISCLIYEYLKVQCVVIFVKTDKRDKIIAYVASDAVPKEVQDKMMEFLRSRLPSYMIPNSFVYDSKLPLTNNGKIDERYVMNLAANN